jgi:tetratricopeptide (TPR) repeat protein
MADTALAESATLQHLPTRIISTFASVSLYQNALDPHRIRAVADPVVELCNRAGIAYYGGILMIFCGWADACLTQDPAAVDLMTDALKRFESTGSRLRVGLFESLIADACLMTGRIDEGTARIESALRNIERYGEYGFRCNALVTHGGLLEAQRDLPAAERSYLQAIEVAQSQGALSLELRAARLMADLLGRTQRVAQGRSLLAPIVDRFESGLQSVDLRLAREWMQAAGVTGLA